MNKKPIRLTESRIRRIIKESVKKVIREGQEQDAQIEEIYQILKNAGLYPEDVFHDDNHPGPVITVRVDGDWKHDHLATKWELSKYGYNELKEIQLEDTGEDCYPADHLVMKASKETIDGLFQLFRGTSDYDY